MSTHTPKPWKAGPVFQKEGLALFVTDDSKPGKLQRRLDDKTGVFHKADAHLLAAAPELLEALEIAKEALEIAKKYVAEHLGDRWQAFREHESVGDIPQIESDLQTLDAAIAKAKEQYP